MTPKLNAIAAFLLFALLPLSAFGGHQITRWKDNHPAAVSITFDDSLYSQVSVGVPMLNARGLKGTFYVLTANGWNEWEGFWDDWRAVAASGHEIGSHTITHAHLRSLSETEARTELQISRDTIDLEITTQKCLSFAYPFGEYNDAVQALAAQYYPYARTVWSKDYLNWYPEDTPAGYTPLDFLEVGSFPFDWPAVTTIGVLNGHLDDAQARGAWYMPHIHPLEDATAIAVYGAFLDELLIRDLWVDTFINVARYMEQRLATVITVQYDTATKAAIRLSNTLDKTIYNVPMTVRSVVPDTWSDIVVVQGTNGQVVEPVVEGSEAVIYYEALADGTLITLTPSTIGVDPHTPVTLEYRVTFAADDAEEAAAGTVWIDSSDLELVNDTWNSAGNQTVGLRFRGVGVPPGATILAAWLQFKVDETGSGTIALNIKGQAADNPATFAATSKNLSNRAKTSAGVTWAPGAWPTVGEAAAAQRSPDLAPVIQEIVNRPGWASGNALALLLTGTGRRTAEAFEGDAPGAPLLHLEYRTGAPVNRAPGVDAGADLSQPLLPEGVFLDGLVNDDGLPADGTLDIQWTAQSGPGSVFFDDETDPATRAVFTKAGTFVLRLTASDGELVTYDEVTIVLEKPGTAVQVAQSRVAAVADDAEEGTVGTVWLDSSDLELVNDTYLSAGNQTVGLRFPNLTIPPGANIRGAWLQFKVDETNAAAAALTIKGQAVDSAPAFTTVAKNVSSRAVTTASVAWAPAAWNIIGDAGAAQLSPDLSLVIQEITSRPGWNSGNALALILTGTGRRTAESFEGEPLGAPQLRVEYDLGAPVNRAPVVNAGLDLSLRLPATSLAIDATVTDDGLPAGFGLAYTWIQVSGPSATIASPAAVDTQVTLPMVGTYVFRLSAYDGEYIGGDDVTVTLLEAAPATTTLEIRVTATPDDAEEAVSGAVDLYSSDLELVYDGYNSAGNQTVGLRFNGLAIPQGAQVVSAWVQFKADETVNTAGTLTLRAQAVDSAPVFTAVAANVSSRALTTASTSWTPASWSVVGEAAAAQRSPELAGVIQEVVSRGGWASGNSLAVIIKGTGARIAESFDGEPLAAPLLHVEYKTPSAPKMLLYRKTPTSR